jgi:phosphoribosylformylglycinamidine synthase PurS subunit
MKVGVKILPRSEVLDSQGRAVERTLKHHGQKLHACRVGKYVQLDLPATTKAEALKAAQTMAEAVLYNPLIETYELECLE